MSDLSLAWRKLIRTSRKKRARSSATSEKVVRRRPSLAALKETRMYPGRILNPKVLVMCQRKADTRDEKERRSENVPLVVSKIDHFVDQIWPGSHPRIDYLSDLTLFPTGVADYNMRLEFDQGRATPEVRAFMNDHQRYYDMVIMHTCPYFDMNYGLISGVLKENGYLAMQSFSSYNDLFSGTIKGLYNFHRHHSNFATLKRLFTPVKSPADPADEYFFQKNPRV